MVDGTLLSTSLIEMIEAVTGSESGLAARQTLLKSLLTVFQMDQASLFTKNVADFECEMALDRSGRIVTNQADVFRSKTYLDQSLLVMEPLHVLLYQHDDKTPVSIKDDSLKQIVCLPLTRSPHTVIFLGSRSVGTRRFTDEQLQQFKIAARASWLAIRQFKTQESLVQTKNELQSLRQGSSTLITASEKMSALVQDVKRIAPFNISLLLLGESGVGKEELARLIHSQSGRPGKFVAINCANLSESLLESELFGYRKGAFTGATQNRDGLFLTADGGTLFLDELAELPMNLQAKLLRVLQERKIRPVGSDSDVSVDVRIIAATHQDLEKRMERGEFRSDLYYRVQEFVLQVPALRERVEDIEILAQHFVTQASMEMNLPRRTLSESALEVLRRYPWPGNVRELKNICRTAVILARDTTVQPQDLRLHTKPTPLINPSSLDASQPPRESVLNPMPPVHFGSKAHLRDLTRKFEKDIVRQLLKEGLSQGEIAARLDVSVRTLQRILNNSDSEISPL